MLMNNQARRSLLRLEVLEDVELKTDHNLVTGTFNGEQSRMSLIDNDPLPKICRGALRIPEAREKFEARIAEIWRDIGGAQFDDADERYRVYHSAMVDAAQILGTIVPKRRPENRKLRKLRQQ